MKRRVPYIICIIFCLATASMFGINNRAPFVILLNGTSSAGKTSTALAIARNTQRSVLMAGADLLALAMPPSNYERWFARTTSIDSAGNTVIQAIPRNAIGHKLNRSTRQKLVRTFAEEGFDVIADEILKNEERMRGYTEILDGITIYFVGLYCDLTALEKREHARGNRPIGLARGQLPVVHQWHPFYDLALDTTKKSPDECAQEILTFIEHTPDPKGLNRCRLAFNMSKKVATD